MTENQDYLAALVHGRRSRMAEGVRLQVLCRTATIADFAREVFSGENTASAANVERLLVEGLAREVVELAPQLPGPVGDLLNCVARRFQLEDLKLLVRRLVTKAPIESLRSHFAPPLPHLRLDVEALAKADSIGALVRLMPSGALRLSLAIAVGLYHEQPRAFFYESALDHGYFAELLAKVRALPEEDIGYIRPIIVQEVDIFHLMLITRGRRIYGLEPQTLLPFHLKATMISRALFESMLAGPGVRALGAWVTGGALDRSVNGQENPSEDGNADPGLLERFAWSRFWRLANRAFRRSHMGLATVLAYVELRRIEVANLITVCEGIRTGIAAERIYARLIPIGSLEASHV